MPILDLTDISPQYKTNPVIPDGTIAICLTRVRAPNPHAGEWLRRSKHNDNQYLDLELVVVMPSGYTRFRIYERIVLVGAQEAVRNGKQALRAALEGISALMTGNIGSQFQFGDWAQLVSAVHDKLVPIRVRHSKREEARPEPRAVFLTPSVDELAQQFAQAMAMRDRALEILPGLKAFLAGQATAVRAPTSQPTVAPTPMMPTTAFTPPAQPPMAPAAMPTPPVAPAPMPTFGQPQPPAPPPVQAPADQPANQPSGWPAVQTTWRP